MPESFKGKRTGIEAIRAREITRVLQHRYGTELPDDDAGRDDIRLMLSQLANFADGAKRITNFLDLWAPWLSVPERVELEREALAGPPARFTSDAIAERLGITWADRTSLALTTIGAIDFKRPERIERRKHLRAQAERERRRRRRLRRESAAAARRAEPIMPARERALVFALNSEDWTSTMDLTARVSTWALFKELKPEARRRVVNRVLDRLKARRVIEDQKPTLATGRERRLVKLVSLQ